MQISKAFMGEFLFHFQVESLKNDLQDVRKVHAGFQALVWPEGIPPTSSDERAPTEFAESAPWQGGGTRSVGEISEEVCSHHTPTGTSIAVHCTMKGHYSHTDY